MTAAPDLPDPAGHPGLRLMEATAAVLRGGQAPQRSDDALGGAFLDDEAPLPLAGDAVEAALARIAALEAIDHRIHEAAGRAGKTLAEVGALPDPLREAVFESIGAGGRWRFLGFGIRGLTLPVGGEGVTELLRIEPGAGVARHDHEGEEYTLVVTGAFHDGHHRFGPGDVNIGRPGFVHEPTAEKDELCFALAVSFGEARFEGPVALLRKLARR
jgi:putative transcriptional regulator